MWWFPTNKNTRRKFFFVAIFRFTISFLDFRFLKIPTLICNAEFRSFSPFYLECLFKFGTNKTVGKCEDFIDYLVVWCKSTTTEMLLEGQKQPKITPCDIWQVWRKKVAVQHCCFEVFLHHFCSMGTLIILVQDPLVLQFQAFPINMSPKDLQDFEVIFLVDGHLW